MVQFIEKIAKTRDDVSLQSYFLPPQGFAKGYVTFVPGISSTVLDYVEFLEPLTANYGILSFNHRDHVASEGIFDPRTFKFDVEAVENTFGQATDYVLSHSIGATIEIDKPHFMIAPCLGKEFLSPSLRLGVSVAQVAAKLPGIASLDALLYKSNISKKLGFHNHKIIQDTAKIAEAKPYLNQFNKVMYALLHADTVLGTDTALQAGKLTSAMQKFYHSSKKAFVDSYPVLNIVGKKLEKRPKLNHCLNLKKGDYAPFGKVEEGKSLDSLYSAITSFYESCPAK